MSKEKKKLGMSAKKHIGNAAIYLILIVMCTVWVIPFVCIVFQSFRVESTYQVGYVIPQQWGMDNYLNLLRSFDEAGNAVWFKTDFVKWYSNTLIMSLVVAVISPIMVLCMSYTLSRFRFKLRKPMMKFMLILGMFPGILTMIIMYRILKDLNLTQANAVPGLILVYVASAGMGYYVTKGYFDTISVSLDEAARVDGASRSRVLFSIIFPLSKPIIIYTVLTAFLGPWGDFIFAKFISFNTSEGMNVAVGLYKWLNKDMINDRYTQFCAGGVLIAIPVTILFLCLQKYYVEGVTGGSVKG